MDEEEHIIMNERDKRDKENEKNETGYYKGAHFDAFVEHDEKGEIKDIEMENITKVFSDVKR